MTRWPLATLQPLVTLGSGLGTEKKLFVLMYHRILSQPDILESGAISLEKFEWQMQLLAEYFNVLPLDKALSGLQEGTIPSRAVCITFDDGYADNYTNALPVLTRYQLPATFFMTSGFLAGGLMWNDRIRESLRIISADELDLTQFGLACYGIGTPLQKAICSQAITSKVKYFVDQEKEDCIRHIESLAGPLPNNIMMSAAQLKLLHASGMEIGGHTVTHPILSKLGDAEVKKEIADNKATLEALLGTTLRFFAYPNGKVGHDYLLKHIEIIKECGYQAALSSRWAVANKNSDIWQLPRCMPSESTPAKFMLRMAYMYNKAD
jgi:peptidoglycan/xylan/chitin deacetylase (PgdA/CDA1 family)